ncbi:MAG: hypothetical protein AB7G21_07020 [Dehalococcoidia bacterium]
MRTTRPAARSAVLARHALAPGLLGLAAMMALGTFILVARAAQAQTPTATATATTTATASPTATGTGTATGTSTATPSRRLELAPIESVEVQVLKSQPPQYQVAVKSGLPGGCAQFNSISADRSGMRIDVTVWNSMPVGNVPCTAIYGYHDSTLNLGSDFAPGTYTVVVNANGNRPMTTTFTTDAGGSAPGGATPTAPRPANTGTGGLGTQVEAMDAIIGGSAMAAALLALSIIVIRVPRRRG